MLISIITVLMLLKIPAEKVEEKEKIVDNGEAKDIEIIVVFDNYSFKENLITSWGFSCFIKGMDKNILFDTGGDGSILLSNMENLGINPGEIEIIILSHNHGDHTGGIFPVLKKNPDVVVYLLESFPDSFKEMIKNYGAEVKEVKSSTEICKDVYSTGELGFGNKEQSLILKTYDGLIVITGCAHPGITRIIEESKKLLSENILFTMGGFHLLSKNSSEISIIIDKLKELGIKYAGPSHCSGDLTREMFKREFGEEYIEVGVGRKISTSLLKTD